MADQIYLVDDGAEWWIAAEDRSDARSKWVQNCIASGSSATEAEAIELFGEPEIIVVPPAEAAGIEIRSGDKTDSCSHCGGTGRMGHYDSLLFVFNEDQKLPVEQRARHGVLHCTVWE